jgi:cellulose synthase/poly-beta-1,6-N-acetylglucosamine synthase-like glycosyltransferase
MNTLSVVVIGRNEGPRLGRCLESVNTIANTGCKVELIYVDSGSSDDSLAIAERRGARTIALHTSRTTAAMGRNAGWRAAAGEIVLFLDGDTILDPRFVVDSIRAFADETIAVVWGHRRELYPERSIYNRVLDLDWIYTPGPSAFCGGDALFRRATLEATGGFDETLIAGEEPELCRRIIARGQVILHVDRAMTMHDLAITRFSQYWQRATRAGYAYAEVSHRFAATGDAFWQEEATRNRQRALMLLRLFVGSIVLTLFLRNVWPLLLYAAAFCGLAARTAWKARWKTRNAGTLLLYGFHSHLQQIPIYIGQLRYRRNRRQGRQASLVEYK